MKKDLWEVEQIGDKSFWTKVAPIAHISKENKRIIAQLAVFALSCHEALVRNGEHVDATPPSISAVADLLGVSVNELVEL